jgi:hypothetical protein
MTKIEKNYSWNFIYFFLFFNIENCYLPIP